jgi:RNA polymerase sigma-70 factor (ECF subfamily)
LDDDLEIVALLKVDHHLGYSKLLKKYRGLVGAIIWRILPGQHEDAEECIADTFIQIWKGASKDKIDGSQLKGLLIYTARNTAINRYRKIKKSPAVPFSDEMAILSSDDALDDLIAKEDASSLMSLISKMSEPDKEILTRRHFLFESVKEISEIMKLPARQIENRLYQSKLRLSRALGERSFTDG